MKKTRLLCTLLSVLSVIPGAYADIDKVDVSDKNTPINWSLAALSSVLRDLYNHHCDVNEPELYTFSDFIYKTKKSTATLNEIMINCKDNRELSSVLQHYEKKARDESCPLDSERRAGFVQESGPSVHKTSCEYYIERLVEAQNNYVSFLGKSMNQGPGLYIKKVSDDKGGIYRIVDFVSDNKAGKAQDKDNVAVYLIGDDLKSRKFYGPKMHLSDLSMAVNYSTAGFTRGMNEASYVYPELDVTDAIVRLCQQLFAATNMLLQEAPELSSGLTRDVKRMMCNEKKDGDWKFDALGIDSPMDWSGYKIRYGSQKDSECHANMVKFQGELVTLDYLGHWLFGCMKRINSGGNADFVESLYDWMADKEQENTSSATKGQAKDDGVLKVFQNEGSAAADKMLVFSNTQTPDPKTAIEMVKNYMVNTGIVNDKRKITKCRATECKTVRNVGISVGMQDYVVCYVGNTLYQYEFDDICNTFGNDDVPAQARSDYEKPKPFNLYEKATSNMSVQDNTYVAKPAVKTVENKVISGPGTVTANYFDADGVWLCLDTAEIKPGNIIKSNEGKYCWCNYPFHKNGHSSEFRPLTLGSSMGSVGQCKQKCAQSCKEDIKRQEKSKGV